MKYLALLFMLIVSVGSAAALVVNIVPEQPVQSQSLLCTVDQGGVYYYYWYKNGVHQSAYFTNTIPAGVTLEDENWRCDVYYPGFPQVLAGRDNVTILCLDDDHDGVCNSDEIPFTSVTATATPLQGAAPLTVTLSCLATGGNQPLTYQWDFTNDGSVDVTGQTVQHTYGQGTYQARCNVHDADNDVTTALTPAITIVPANHPPILNLIGNRIIAEGQTLTLTISANDSDGDSLNYSASNLPVGASFNAQSRAFTWTPSFTQAGVYENILFSVTDGQAMDSESIRITVTNTNRPPYFSPTLQNRTVSEQQLLQFTVNAVDPDGDALNYSAGNLPAGASFNAQSRMFSWTPNYAQAGVYLNVRFTVSDGSLQVVQNITITVADDPQPPHAQFMYTPEHPIRGQDVFLDASSSYDVDGPITSYAWDFTSDGYVDAYGVNTTHAFQQGNNVVTLRVGQGGQYSSTNLTIFVTERPNHPPVLQHIGNKVAAENRLLTFTVTATDEDADTLQYGAYHLPQGSTFNTLARTFSWTPTYDQAGFYPDVAFTVTDGRVIVEERINITVNNTNRLPDAQWNYTPQPVHVNETVFFNVTYSHDPDNDPLTFDWDFEHDGIWDAHGRTVTHIFTTLLPPYHCYGVWLRVFDGTDYFFSQRCITVLPANSPPVAEFTYSPELPLVNENVLFNASDSTDPDGDVLTYRWDFDADGSIDAEGVLVEHSFDTEGTYPVLLNVSDGRLWDVVIHIVPMHPTNRPPVFVNLTDHSVAENTTLSFAVLTEDPDRDVVNITTSRLPSNASFSDDVFVWTPSFTQAGVYAVAFTASDGRLSTTAIVNITVLNTNRAPNAAFLFTPPQPLVNQIVLFNANPSYDPDSDALLYYWDFANDGTWDATGMLATYRFDTPGTYPVRLLVTDVYNYTDTIMQYVVVQDLPPLTTAIDCLDVVVQGSNQSCQVHVFDDAGAPVRDALVTVLFTLPYQGTMGTCTTSAVGGCSVIEELAVLGNYTAHATAVKTGYIADTDAFLETSFRVIPRGYDIRSLSTFNDSLFLNPDNLFYRGENLYVTFSVWDNEGNRITRNIITSVELVSPQTGGHATLEALGLQDGTFRYALRPIPLNHDFNDTGEVFAFVFNFAGDVGGEEQAPITILNNPPEIHDLPSQVQMHVHDTTTFRLTHHEFDLEDSGDNLTWLVQAAAGAPFTATLNNKLLTISAQDVGEGTLTLTLRDFDNDEDVHVLHVNVTELPQENIPPVLHPIGPRSGQECEPLVFTVTAEDANGDPIILSAEGLPRGATFTNGNFAWTPANGQNGTYVTTFIASDGQLTDSENVPITITDGCQEENHAPVFNSIDAPGCVSVGTTITFDVSAQDADNDVLTYWASGIPQGATFITTPDGGTFTWHTTAPENRTVTFSVSDGQDITSRQVFLCVLAPQNDAPQVIIVSPEDETTVYSRLVTFIGEGYDAEDGMLADAALTWTSDIDGVLGTGRQLAAELSYGEHTITLVGMDSDGATATDIITITVLPIPDNATLVAVLSPPYAGFVNEPLTFDGSQSIGSIVRYEWAFGDNTTAITFAPWATHTYDLPQDYAVTLTVVDVYGQRNATTAVYRVVERSSPRETTQQSDRRPVLPELMIYGTTYQDPYVIHQGEDLVLMMDVINKGKERWTDVRVQLVVPELDLKGKSSAMTLRSNEKEHVSIVLPMDAWPEGEYEAHVIIGNGLTRRAKYVPFTIVGEDVVDCQYCLKK